MISAEAQRTLVKSPPELWAELSDPDSLARHLAELGEIRILASKPETKVEWEGEGISGVVELKPSGWGTKVTLSAMRQAPACLPPAMGGAPQRGEPPMPVEPEPAPPEPRPEVAAEPAAQPEPEPEPIAEVEPADAPEPRPGFFARIFRRWRRPAPTPQAKAAQPDPEAIQLEPEAAQPEAAQPEPEAAPETPGTEPEPQAEEQPDIAAELLALEESMAAETTAVLTAVLDRLGQAHHRPFSRA